jgi:hypothetical protein
MAGSSALTGFAETFWMVAGFCLLATLAALRMQQRPAAAN